MGPNSYPFEELLVNVASWAPSNFGRYPKCPTTLPPLHFVRVAAVSLQPAEQGGTITKRASQVRQHAKVRNFGHRPTVQKCVGACMCVPLCSAATRTTQGRQNAKLGTSPCSHDPVSAPIKPFFH